MTYTIQYSRDGGQTWQTLNTGWSQESLTVDPGNLGATSNGLVRVKASDGFNTAKDKSDGTFTTSNTGPDASIFSPQGGAVIDSSGTVFLEGEARDLEDGPLSGSSLEWRTGSGTTLGTGETLEVPASSLSLGTHQVTLSATDSGGETAQASIEIHVALSGDPALQASHTLTVGSGGLQEFGDTGALVSFSGTSGSGSVTAEKYGSRPIGAGGIELSNVSDYRFLIRTEESLDFGSDTEVRFEVRKLGGIEDPSNVTIYHRPTPGNGPFSALETKVDEKGTPSDVSDDVLYAKVSRLSEFVFASNSEMLPVEMSGFKATLDGAEAVRLTWTTSSETNNAGFRVQRKQGPASSEKEWRTIGQVEGQGTTTKPTSYQFRDENLPYEADALTYRLKQIDADGSTSYSKEVTVEREVEEAQLLGTYPNPTSRQATLRYAVPGRQNVTIHLYDVLGRKVKTVVDGEKKGRQERQLDVTRLASGVYFLRLKAESATKTQRLTVVR